MKLEDFLARVYDRTQRTKPQTQHRAVVTWDSLEATSTYKYPYKWATSAASWNPSRHAKWDSNAHWAMAWPTYIACGTGIDSGTGRLTDEYARFPITVTYDFTETEHAVRFAAEAPKTGGVGDWGAVALYYGDAITTVLTGCDSLYNQSKSVVWRSTGTLTIDTTEVRDGVAAFRIDGGDNLWTSDPTAVNTPTSTEYTESTTKIQLWYYISDNSVLLNYVYLYLLDSTSHNYYCFRWHKDNIASGWNWLSAYFSDYYSKVGSISITSISNISFGASKSSLNSIVERVDRIRVYKDSGILWASAEIDPAYSKQWGEARWIYWNVVQAEP